MNIYCTNSWSCWNVSLSSSNSHIYLNIFCIEEDAYSDLNIKDSKSINIIHPKIEQINITCYDNGTIKYDTQF